MPSGIKTSAMEANKAPPPKAKTLCRNSFSSHEGRMFSIRAIKAPRGIVIPAIKVSIRTNKRSFI